MTGQLSALPGRRIVRSRLLALAVLASLMVVAIGFVSPAAAAADCSLPGVNKTFAVDITPHSVTAGAVNQDFTLKLCNDSPVTTTQQLGSVNVTPPPGFTAKSINLPGCSTPIGQSGATCGDVNVVNNVFQIRNIKLQPALPPANQVSFGLKADVPTTCAEKLLWTAKGRQSNNFQGAKNDLTLDEDDSDRRTDVVGCTTAPSADLSVGQVYNQEPQTAGNEVVDTVTVTNAGPSDATSVELTITLGNGATFATHPKPPPVSGSGWACTVDGANKEATCSRGAIAAGTPAPDVTAFIQTPPDVGTITCGSESDTGICTTATVSAAESEPNPDPSPNTSSELLSLTPQEQNVARGTVTSAGGTVTTGPCVGATCYAMTFTFPANAAITTPYVFQAIRDLPPGNFCGAGTACDVSMLSDDIKLDYQFIVMEMVSGPELTPGGGTTPWTFWKEGQFLPTQIPLCAEDGSSTCAFEVFRDEQGNLHAKFRLPGGDPRIGEKCYLRCSP